MTQKFGRNYRLTIDPKDGGLPIIITMPFTCRFNVQRNILSDLNRFYFDIYNLSEVNRNRIFQDRFDFGANRTVIFEAGYATLYRAAVGRIYEASSAREGVDIITRIEARDGSYDIATSQVFTTQQSGQTLGSVMKFLIGQFPTLTLGAVGDYSQIMQRPVVLNGSTWELLKRYSNNQVYIDNAQVYVLQDYETLKNTVPVLNDSSGLLETPRRDEGFLSITSLMETGIDLSQQVQIESSIQKVYNGTYKVISVQHQGIISAAVNAPTRSIFGLQAPNRFRQFQGVSSS